MLWVQWLALFEQYGGPDKWMPAIVMLPAGMRAAP